MANKSSNYLYELIKSLTKAEKRYFKVYVSRHTGNNTENNNQILFDAIDKQEEFNEDELLKSLKKHLFVKKFSITKARLYDTILKSLDAFYAEKSITKIILNEIHFISILYDKSLYKQCAKRIISAKKLAQKHNKNELLKEIINWEKKLIEKDNYANTKLQSIKKLVTQENELLNKISLDTQLWELKSILFQHINTKGRARSNKEVDELKNIVYQKLKLIDALKSEIKLYYSYLHIKAAYYFAIYEYEKCFITLEETINHLENNKLHFKEEPNILFSVLNNCVYLAIQLKKEKKAQEYYKKLKLNFNELKEEASEDLMLKLKSSLLSLELSIIKNTHNFSNSDAVLTSTIHFINSYKPQINESRLAYLYFNLASIYFLKQNYSEALKWINSLLNDINIDTTQEIYSFAQILNLVIHLELDNKELVLYTIKSTKRFLQTRNKLFDFETIMLNFIRDISSENDFFEKSEAYEKLVVELTKIKQHKYETIPLESFDYLSWAKAKTLKKPIKEIVKTGNISLSY